MAKQRKEFTPTEERILALLSDGLRHERAQVFSCLDDELAGPTALDFHIATLRPKLRRKGQEIVMEMYNGGKHYRHVRLLHSPDE